MIKVTVNTTGPGRRALRSASAAVEGLGATDRHIGEVGIRFHIQHQRDNDSPLEFGRHVKLVRVADSLEHVLPRPAPSNDHGHPKVPGVRQLAFGGG
jgi:hypothetical protein